MNLFDKYLKEDDGVGDDGSGGGSGAIPHDDYYRSLVRTEKYPELNDISLDIVDMIMDELTHQLLIDNESDLPYQARYVLKNVIAILNNYMARE